MATAAFDGCVIAPPFAFVNLEFCIVMTDLLGYVPVNDIEESVNVTSSRRICTGGRVVAALKPIISIPDSSFTMQLLNRSRFPG